MWCCLTCVSVMSGEEGILCAGRQWRESCPSLGHENATHCWSVRAADIVFINLLKRKSNETFLCLSCLNPSHLASSLPAALASRAATRRVQSRHPRSPGAVCTLPATWLTTAASSLMRAQEDCARLTRVRFSSVGRAPTSATEPSLQLDLESGTICWRTLDSRTCQAYMLYKKCSCVLKNKHNKSLNLREFLPRHVYWLCVLLSRHSIKL